jgi:hypothetical protein
MSYMLVTQESTPDDLAKPGCRSGSEHPFEPAMRFLPKFRSVNANDVDHLTVYADGTAIDHVDFRLGDLIR